MGKVYEYAAGDTLKSTGEWKRGKKSGFFDDVVKVSKQIFYVDESRSPRSNISLREASDEENVALRRSKRRNVATSPGFSAEGNSGF